MTWAETDIANALDGKFYRIAYNGKTVDGYARKHARTPCNTAKWSPQENDTLIRLYLENIPIRDIAKTMRRDRRLIRGRIKALVAQGVLSPRKMGWKPVRQTVIPVDTIAANHC